MRRASRTPDLLLQSEDAFASSGSLDSMAFWWQGGSAMVTAAGRDELVSETLRNAAGEILEAGSVEPEEEASLRPIQRVVERQTQLPLAPGRFAGTYEDVHRLINDLADQVRLVRGGLESAYMVLSEHGTTLTVRSLGELGQITGRDVHRLRHLTISLGGTADSPSLLLYISVRRVIRHMSGTVTGPDEAPVRALRAAASDLLRDRCSAPRWMPCPIRCSSRVRRTAFGLLLVREGTWPVRAALLGIALIVSFHIFYLPQVEFLGPLERTRWSRWSRYVVGLAVVWLVGSLAIPLLAH